MTKSRKKKTKKNAPFNQPIFLNISMGPIFLHIILKYTNIQNQDFGKNIKVSIRSYSF